MAEILIRVQAIVAKTWGIDAERVQLDTRFEQVGVDSTDLIDLVVTLEEEFDFEIIDEDADKFQTVDDVVSYLKAHL